MKLKEDILKDMKEDVDVTSHKEDKPKYRTMYVFNIDAIAMLKGELNKNIKSFLNQLDLKDLDKQTKEELRQSFLDSMNNFSRFSVGLIKYCVKFNNKVE